MLRKPLGLAVDVVVPDIHTILKLLTIPSGPKGPESLTSIVSRCPTRPRLLLNLRDFPYRRVDDLRGEPNIVETFRYILTVLQRPS